MAICILSSVLAFCAGFLFCLLSMTKCSQEKWEKIKTAIEKARVDSNNLEI